MASSSVCKHCGSPVPASRMDDFCCAGCAYVYDLLHQQNLDHFYDLRGERALSPVSPQSLREQDYEWLGQMAREKETAGELKLALQGVSCIGCVWLIEKVFSRHAGGLRVNVDVVHGELQLSYIPGGFDIVAFAKDMQAFGYLLGPPHEETEFRKDKDLERRMGVCGAFAMNAMAFSLPAYFGMPADFAFASWFDMIAAASATLAMFVGGSYFIEKSWRSLRNHVLHIDTPIALGITAAYLGSLGGWMAGVADLKYFDFVAIFIFLMLTGRWAQQAAVERNRRKLMRDTSVPEKVMLPGDDRLHPLTVLKPGVRFIVKPAQSIPVACRLIDPHAQISLEWIDGESEAQQRDSGQMLPSGALNIGLGRVEVEALEEWQHSTLKKLLEARRPGEFRDRRLERLLRFYLATIVLVGIGGAIGWLLHGAPVSQALQVMISIFVVSCPCALGVAIPLVEELAVARAEKHGVFVRHLGFWKRLCQVRGVVFDKTGTLTLENPVLENASALEALNDEARGALRTLVSGNLHPVSRSLFDALGPGSTMAESEVTEIAGHGLSLTDKKGSAWNLGRGEGVDALFQHDGVILARFFFRDELRAESVDEVRSLQRRGMDVHILSGDRDSKVAHIARQLGLPDSHWQSSLTPEQKAAWINTHGKGGVLYVGDGANDSLAFDAALCTGSPVTGRSFLEQKADFFFLGHSLRFVSSLLDTAQLARRATRFVFAFSLLYNLVTVTVGLMGHLSPLAAAILMPLSSVATLSIVALTFGWRKNVTQPLDTRDGYDRPVSISPVRV